MGSENIWSEDHKGLYKKMSGEISVIDVLSENNAMFQNRQFDQLNYVIYDFREVTLNRAFNPDELGSIAKVVRVRSNTKDDMKLAIISRNNFDSIKAAQSFCQFISNTSIECQAFVDAEEARAWATN